MNKFIKYIPMAVMAFGLGSCADDLDITPDGRLTMDEVWSNADYTESFLSSAFDQIPKKHVNYYWFDNLPSALSDDGWSCDDVEGVGPVLARSEERRVGKECRL